MLTFPYFYTDTVHDKWIDRNQHMNDAEYARVFSLAIDAFHDQIGLTNEARDQRAYTVFTLETHISYLKELPAKTPFKVQISVYQFDYKRTHFFLELINEHTNDCVATAETMMMGISRQTGKSAPYPDDIYQSVQTYYDSQPQRKWPQQLGHRIAIPKS